MILVELGDRRFRVYPATFSPLIEGKREVVRVMCSASDDGGIVYSADSKDREWMYWKSEPIKWRATISRSFQIADKEAALVLAHLPANATVDR